MPRPCVTGVSQRRAGGKRGERILILEAMKMGKHYAAYQRDHQKIRVINGQAVERARCLLNLNKQVAKHCEYLCARLSNKHVASLRRTLVLHNNNRQFIHHCISAYTLLQKQPLY